MRTNENYLRNLQQSMGENISNTVKKLIEHEIVMMDMAAPDTPLRFIRKNKHDAHVVEV